MESARYPVAGTTRRNKVSSYDTTATVNTAISRRQASSAGDFENYHPGRRQRSRRRDVYAAPDDFVRVSTLSHPDAAVVDAVRNRVNGSDLYTKSTTLWAQPTFVASSGTTARSRSRPRPPFSLQRGVQHGELSGEYVRNLAETNRFQEQQLTDESHHRHRYQQRQQQQQQRHASSRIIGPSAEFAARSPIECRPQLSSHPTALLADRTTVTSPTSAPLSPSYLNDNKALLKEAIISAAAAKLARSSSARSAVVRPVVVVRNGPLRSSSDEHVDTDDDDVTTTTIRPPLSSDRPDSAATSKPSEEHTEDVAVAVTAAAAAATRRSRTRRRDAEKNTTTSSYLTASSAIPATSQADTAVTQRTRAVNSHSAADDQVFLPSSAFRMQDNAEPVNCGGPPFTATQALPKPNCEHVDDIQRPPVLRSTSGTVATDTTHDAATLNMTKIDCTAGDNRKDHQQQSTSDTPNDWNVHKTANSNSITEPEITSVIDNVGTNQEVPSSMSKVSFIKTILSRTRSPSPSRCRRSRSKALHTSPSPSSVKRFGAEVAQRISEPVKGYLKQLRDRSSQRRRPAEQVATSTVKIADESEPSACELASTVDSQSRPSDECSSAGTTASCDGRSTDDMSSQGRRFAAGKKKQDSGTSVLTSQWKSTSELTTPMSRLDSLLKANSLQHLQTSATAAFQTKRPTVDDSESLSKSSPLPVLSNTNQSTGCLLSSSARSETQLQQSVERQRSTTMTRCYLEKPPRAARRAMTVQLERRQTPSVGITERQSTSQADLCNAQPAVVPSLNEEHDDFSRATKYNDVSKLSANEMTSEKRATASVSSLSRRLPADNHASSSSSSSQNQRDLRELYEQKRLERQLEEKLASMEKERADMIAKLWSQIDHRCETNAITQQRPAAVTEYVRGSSSSSGLVLPLSSPAENNSQVVGDPLSDLLVELSSTPTTMRWSERRRGGRSTTVQLRPRAASCSRRLTSDTPLTSAALPSKSLSHTQLHRNPSNCSDVSYVHLRQRSHQQLQSASTRPLTCYLPVRDRNLDLRRFIETAGHRLDQCEHVQLTSTSCHGYLSKYSAGSTVRPWKRRWFVFDRTQRSLQYYTDKTEKRTDGAFIWFQTIQDVFVDHERRSRSTRPESTFCVKTLDRSLFLMAPTPETMRIWIDVIFTGAEGYQQFV